MKVTGTFEFELESPVVIHRKMMKCICHFADADLHEGSCMKTCGFTKNRYGLYESLGDFSKVMSKFEVECTCGELMGKWVKEGKYQSKDENAYGWCEVMVTCSCDTPKPDYLVELVKC